jgi:hypothetical protein
MKDFDSNRFLIPLLAAFAIFLPFSFTSTSSDRRSSEQPQSPALIQMGSLATPTPKPAPRQGRVSGEAARLICDFFGFKPEPDRNAQDDGQKGESDAPQNFDPKILRGDYCSVKTIWNSNRPEHRVASNYKRNYMIATVPDPKDSRLDYMFDRNLDAIQRAIAMAGYTFDRYYLPWDISRTTAPAVLPADQKTPQAASRHLYEPGVILFRGSDKLLLLFLVGETPTGGIHRVAFQNALLQIEELAGWKRSKSEDETDDASEKTLRIVGPTFSGSAESLSILLAPWIHSYEAPPQVRVVSGSATSVDKADFLDKIGWEGVSFHTTIVSVEQAGDRFYEYLDNLDSGIERIGDGRPARARIALLSEAGTGYGQRVRKLMGGAKQSDDQSSSAAPRPPTLSFIFPLHISQLRVEASKRSPSRDEAVNALAPKDLKLTLPMSEAGSPASKDIVPLFSPLETVTMELALKETLTTIHRERIRYVGVSATDVQDRIFLVREIRKHCPNALVFFILSNDLLYLHPESNLDFQGALVISPYPLFGLNQSWTHPFAAVRNREQFPTQSSQGIYNATLALLDRNDLMLEYGFPYEIYKEDEPHYPALWLGVVGRSGIWPVKTFRLNIPNEEKSYALPARSASSGAGASTARDSAAPRLGLSGDYWSPSGLGVLSLIGIMCLLIPVLFLMQRIRVRTRRVRTRADRVWQGPLAWIGQGWPARVFGDEEFYRYREDRSVNVIYCCVCLCAAAFFISSVSLMPARIASKLTEKGVIETWDQYRVLGGAAVLIMVSSFGVLLWLAWLVVKRPGSERRYFRRNIGMSMAIIVCAVMIILAIWGLIRVFLSDPLEQVFFFLRASDLTNGVSILPPGLLIALATFLSLFTVVRRLTLAERMPCLRGPQQRPSDAPQFLRFDHEGARSFNGLKALENRVKEMIVCPIHEAPGAWLVAIMILIVYCYLVLPRLIPSVDGCEFDWFFKLGFYIAPLLLFWALLRFFWLWTTLEKLSRRLSWHPLISRFAAAHSKKERFVSLPPVDLITIPKNLAALSASVWHARSFCDLLEPSPEQAETAERVKLLVKEAEDKLSLALQSNARGDWLQALVNQRDSQAVVAELSESVTSLLEDSWGEGSGKETDAGKVTDIGKETDADWRNEGKFFLIAHVVAFLHHIFAQMQSLVLLVTAGLVLMLIAANSYPFQPREPLRLFSWIGIMTSVAVTFYVFVKISRDKTLSLFAGTTPDKLNLTRDFVTGVLIHGVFPLLALLGLEFPEAIRGIVSWLSVLNGKGK